MNAETWQQLKELFHAAVELAPHDREAFLEANCAADDELHCEVSALLSAHESAGDFIQQPALVDVGLVANAETNRSEAVTGQQIGSYQIIRELGRGGMGSVYLAARADESFDKQVALKLIKRGMDSDAIIKRFVMERQILANLDHPNIARLIDGGTTEDGLPYFVLEYIEGTTITRYCDQHKLNTIERLKLFRQVCAAVQFAHQNLIVHRDLKPSNIIVTEDGTPKLLDFGIAKLLSADWSSSVEATATIGRVLTPEYASPEELRGLPVTTSSDVYSLGVVLYELLSGHRPFYFESRSPEDAARLITSSEPMKPSVVITRIEGARHTDDTEHISHTPEAISRTRDGNIEKLRRRLAGDLDNILLKALRKEPERRYASVQEFSEDLRRHSEGLPVLARPDTLSYRTSKFITRHKAGVAAAVIVLLTLLSATVITGWQARVARRERDKSERRFGEVRKLAHAVLFKYHDAIEKLPGSTPVREMLVQDALGYLDSLSKESADDLSLQRELAAAYKKVGDVQGGLTFGHTGDTRGMLDSYRKALAIREAVAAANPANRDDHSALAGIYVDVGSALDRAGDPASKMAMSRKALAIYLELSAAGGTGNSLRSDTARAYWHVANASVTLGDLQSGIENYRSAGKIYEELSAAEPSNQLHRRNVALTDKYLASIFELSGDHIGAQELFRKAVTLDQVQVAGDPDNAGSKLDLAFSYRELGTNLYKAGDLSGASDNLQKALGLTFAVVEADPKNAFARRALAAVYQKIGEIMSKQGNLVAALENHQRATETYRALVAADPTNAEAKSYEARSYSALGATYTILASSEKSPARKQLADWKAALLWFQRSSDIWASLRKQGPLIDAFKKEPEKVAGEITGCEVALVRLIGARSKK